MNSSSPSILTSAQDLPLEIICTLSDRECKSLGSYSLITSTPIGNSSCIQCPNVKPKANLINKDVIVPDGLKLGISDEVSSANISDNCINDIYSLGNPLSTTVVTTCDELVCAELNTPDRERASGIETPTLRNSNSKDSLNFPLFTSVLSPLAAEFPKIDKLGFKANKSGHSGSKMQNLIALKKMEDTPYILEVGITNVDAINETGEGNKSFSDVFVSKRSTLPFLGETPGFIDDITPKEMEVFTKKFKKHVVDVRLICDVTHKKFSEGRPRTQIFTQGKIFSYDKLEPCSKSKSIAKVKIDVISSKKRLPSSSGEIPEPTDGEEGVREMTTQFLETKSNDSSFFLNCCSDSEVSGDGDEGETPHVIEIEASGLDNTPCVHDVRTPDASVCSDSNHEYSGSEFDLETLNPEALPFVPRAEGVNPVKCGGGAFAVLKDIRINNVN